MYKHTLNIDIETRSSIDLRKSGAFKYSESPDFSILLFGYAIDGGPVSVIDLARGEKIPEQIVEFISSSEVKKKAFNASFEWICLLNAGFKTNIMDWYCTKIKSWTSGYPGSLKDVGQALGIDKEKLDTGTRLINKFSKPRKPTKNNPNIWVNPEDAPEDWELYKLYNARDVEAEMEIDNCLGVVEISDFEHYLWALDCIHNLRGIAVDVDLVNSAQYCAKIAAQEQHAELTSLTGIINPRSVPQFKEWIGSEIDEEIESVGKKHLLELLSETKDPLIKKAIELKLEISKSSIKKYEAISKSMGKNNRVRGSMQYYGAAATGRYAGRLIQPQNFSKNKTEFVDLARYLVKARDIEALKFTFGSIPGILSELTRTALIPTEGNLFVDVDFSAIEARILPWYAGEKWRNEVFATHGKIYEASASAMFNVPFDSIKKGEPNFELRQKGKVAELALGYQGGTGALISMGALKMGLTEEELPDIVTKWRAASPTIVKFWNDLNKRLLFTVRTGQMSYLQTPLYCIVFRIEGDGRYNYLTVQLPSGRKLYYADPRMTSNRFGNESISYLGKINNKWARVETYGGKMCENIVQATARDCLVNTLYQIEQLGYNTVMHIHDEVVCDVPKDKAEQALIDIKRIMASPISWAPGLMLKGEGQVSPYFIKD